MQVRLKIMDKKNNNIQLQPVKKILVPIDKLNSGLFGVENLKLEKNDGKKNQYTFTDSGVDVPIFLEPSRGELNISDFALFCAICSEYSVGNKLFTIRRLWRKIGGSHTLTDEMKNFISDSVDKLAFTKFTADLSKLNNKHHYTDDCEKIFKGYLLPIKSVERKINGQTSECVFQIIDTPPLLEIAMLKKQLAAYDFKMLDVPNLRITPITLKIKFYLFYRTICIVGSRKPHNKHFRGRDNGGGYRFKTATKLQPIILFNTLFEQCGLADADRFKQRDARETIKKILDHFKAENLISDWHFEKKNGKFYSIHLII